jgi:hypothetical protein
MLFPLALVPVPAIGFASVRELKLVLVVLFEQYHQWNPPQ